MDKRAPQRMKAELYRQRQNTCFTKAILLSWLLPSTIILLAACGGSELTVEPETNESIVFVNPYKNECLIAGELQLCYVTSLGDRGEFSPYTGQIQNFEYQWGYEYELMGMGDEDLFQVQEIGNKLPEAGGLHFPLTITGGDNRIVEIADGVFEFYGEKSFTCSPEADCENLRQVIDREEPIEFEFETPENPDDPYTLLSWESES
jgi:hypothetical protein